MTSPVNESDPIVSSNEVSESSQLNHVEMKEVFREALKKLFDKDPILNDLYSNITYQEIQGLVDVEKGKSILVTVLKEDGDEYALRVPRESCVFNLKAALKTKVSLQMQRRGNDRNINWRTVWRKYALFNPDAQELLTDDNVLLTDVGVTHKTLLIFKPIKRNKNKVL